MKLVAYNDPNDMKIEELKLNTPRPDISTVCRRMLQLFINMFGLAYVKTNFKALEEMFLLSAKLAQQPYSPAVWLDSGLCSMQNLFLLIWDIG